MTKKIIIPKEYLYQKYIVENLSSYDIADELKCNVSTICKYIKEFKLIKDSKKKFEARDIKTRKTSIKKYGVDWPSKSKEIQEKIENTTIERFGVKHASQSVEIKQKVKDTNLKRFGYEYTLQNPELMKKRNKTCIERYGTIKPQDLNKFKEKAKQTNLNRYGVTNFTKTEKYKEKTKITCQERYKTNNPSQSKEIKEKIKKNNLEKYGVENTTQLFEIKEKMKQTCIKRYGVENASQNNDIKIKKRETYRKNKSWSTSKPEDEIYKIIFKSFPNVIRQYNCKLYPFDCDFYIPELDLYIEYQGTFEHGVYNKNKVYGPYDPNNPEHQALVKEWQKRANEGHLRYLQAIDVWTHRDPLKRQTAAINHLNWLEFFTMDQFLTWYNSLSQVL